MSFPFIKKAYPFSSVTVIGDAGNGVTEPYFIDNSIENWNVQMPTWIDGFEDGYTPDMTIADIYKNIANYYPYARVGQFTTAWDWNQTFFYNVMLTIDKYREYDFHPEEWNCYEPTVSYDWHDQMYSYAYETAESPNYRYYIAAGTYHMIMMSAEFYTEDSAGLPFIDWVDAMVGQPFETPGVGGDWQNLECEECGYPLPLACP